MSGLVSQIRSAGLAYLEKARSGNSSDDQWEQVDIADGHLTVQPSPEATASVLWEKLFDQLFVQGMPEVKLQCADDILYFVRKAQSSDRSSRLFVRRKASRKPADCSPGGKDHDSINWPATAMLNLVMQSPYYMTVSACRARDTPHVLEYGHHHADIRQVIQPVFASPMRVDVNLDSSRTSHSEPQVTYPNMCFAVDNFDCAFESMVLRRPDDCYVVCLWGAAPLPPDPPTAGATAAESQQGLREQVTAAADRLQQIHLANDKAAVVGGAARNSGQEQDAVIEQPNTAAAAHRHTHCLHDGLCTSCSAEAAVAGKENNDCRLAGNMSATQGPATDARNAIDRQTNDSSLTDGRNSIAGELRNATGSHDQEQHRQLAECLNARKGQCSTTSETGACLLKATSLSCASGHHPLAEVAPTIATEDAAAPPDVNHDASSNQLISSDLKGETDVREGGANEPKAPMVLLFSGYVPYSKLQTIVDTTGLHPMRLWTKSGESQQRVRMKGPGGVGYADVAVTAGGPPAKHNASRLISHEEDGFPAATMLQLQRGLLSTAARLAEAAARAAKDIAVGSHGGAVAPPATSVRCALMTLTLPVDDVARKLLSNGTEQIAGCASD